MLKRLAIENKRKTSRQLSFQLHQKADVVIFLQYTVRRRLHESELHSRRPRKKPLLTDKHRGLDENGRQRIVTGMWRHGDLSFLAMKPKLAAMP